MVIGVIGRVTNHVSCLGSHDWLPAVKTRIIIYLGWIIEFYHCSKGSWVATEGYRGLPLAIGFEGFYLWLSGYVVIGFLGFLTRFLGIGRLLTGKRYVHMVSTYSCRGLLLPYWFMGYYSL